MLRPAVSRRPFSTAIAVALSLLLLVTQQWGSLHLLSHGLHGTANTATATATATAGDETSAHEPALVDAGDVLCQVCLVLAAVGAAALPALWRWLVRAPRAARLPAPPRPAAARPEPAPWHARGPPVLH
jgi:hypothetical protein